MASFLVLVANVIRRTMVSREVVVGGGDPESGKRWGMWHMALSVVLTCRVTLRKSFPLSIATRALEL